MNKDVEGLTPEIKLSLVSIITSEYVELAVTENDDKVLIAEIP